MTEKSAFPRDRDFDPWNGNLDAQSAWEHFGGLSLDEAEAKFRGNPRFYQEDFMFMGGRAFAYYFPVIENYLRTIPDIVDEDDHEAWILSHCILTQFDDENLDHVRHLAVHVIDLSKYIRDNLRRFGADDNERQRVADAWAELARYIQTFEKK